MPALIRLALIGCLGGTTLLVAPGPAPAETWRVTVKGDAAITASTLIVAEVPGNLPSGSSEVLKDGPKWVASYQDAGKHYLVFPAQPLKRGEGASFSIRGDQTLSTSDKGGKSIENRPQGDDVTVRLDRRDFATYRVTGGPKPYYFPVIGPDGRRYTRAYPMEKVADEDQDHPHQRSMWFTHGSVNGFDFWAPDPLNKPNPKSGSIKETSRTILADSPNLGVLRTTDDWLGPDGKKVCQDRRTVLFSGTEDFRVIDFDITIEATAAPVTFGDTKEGMFGLRVASSMDVKRKQGGKITNAEGVTDNDAWGKASPWVDYTGPVGGKTVGIAILNHPDSFRYPTTWHVRDYGLFAANPFGWHDFGMKKSGEHTVPAGKSIRFRYRVLLHTGDTSSANIPSAFNAYAKPPTVSVEKE